MRASRVTKVRPQLPPILLGLTVALGVGFVASDVTGAVLAAVIALPVVVVGLRFVGRPGPVAAIGVAIGVLAFPILSLAGINALMAQADVPRLGPLASLFLGAALVFAAAWAFQRRWWARENARSAPLWAAAIALVVVVAPPFALRAVQAVQGDERSLAEPISAISKLDVIVLRDSPGDPQPALQETRGWEVRTWVGQVEDGRVDWGAGGAPEPPTGDSDRVLLLMPSGQPERPAGEVKRWLRLADRYTPRLTPTYAVLRTTDEQKLAVWRDALDTPRSGDAIALQGERTTTDLALQLAVLAPSSDQDLALAAKHRPLLFFDRGEPDPRPLNIDQVLRSGKVRLCKGNQSVTTLCPEVHGTADINNGSSNLAFDPEELAAVATDSTIYVNVTRSGNDHANAIYLDYWWYLPNNPTGAAGGAFCGAGFVIAGLTCLDHQSDWEGVTVTLDGDKPDAHPTAVSYAQHNGVTRYSWAALRELWRRDARWTAEHRVDTRERPLVFVADGTHASYPQRCVQERCAISPVPGSSVRRPFRESRHDGGRPWPADERNCPTVCLLALPTRNNGRDPARWNAFTGYWGTSKCVLEDVCTQADPPRSPAAQGRYRHPWCRATGVTFSRGRFAAEAPRACAARVPSATELGTGERLLALGDSFSSGQGAGDYEPGTNGDGNTCFRSPAAWTQKLARRLRLMALPSLACSGGLIVDVEDGRPRGERERRISQISRIAGDPGIVTLTIGGNNAGFAAVLGDCVFGDCVAKYHKPSGDLLDAQIARIGARLPGLYSAIRRAAPRARLVVAGYPRLFADTNAAKPVGNCAAGRQISRREASYLNERLGKLNAASAVAAQQAGVDFIDVSDAFDGQELRCGGPSYLNRLQLHPRLLEASFHPNARGHARLADVVASRLSMR